MNKQLSLVCVLFLAGCYRDSVGMLEEICLDRDAPVGRDDVTLVWGDATPEEGDITTIADDGGWCWFQDERAIFADDRLVVGSVSHRGDVQVSSYDTATQRRDHFVLAPEFDRDDHAAPSLQRLDDGRIRAFYTKHLGSRQMHSRVTRAGDGGIGAWEADQPFTGAPDDNICYSNLLSVRDRVRDGAQRLFLFFRGLNYNPTFMVSDDGGDTWTGRTQLLDSWEVQGPKDGNHRPYVKYVSDGDDTIHFLYTEGHPGECNLGTECVADSVYHMFYRDGVLHRSNGEPITAMTPGRDVAIDPTQGTLIYDGQCSAFGEAWVWDLALDHDGNPVVVFASFPSRDDVFGYHVYHWARWDGEQWQRRVIGHGGSGLYEHEKFYSGGITIDPDDTDVVYFSSNVNPANKFHIGTGRYEIYRARALDADARRWEVRAITESSDVDNLRPIVPQDHPYETAVLWMRGEYRTYTDYDTRIVGLFASSNAVARGSVR